MAGDTELRLAAERLARLRDHHDALRRTLILEPRGSDALVGALLCEPTRTDCAAGVLFFNNRGYLGMCGHGSIGVAVTLGWLGRINHGVALLETPVGVVSVELAERSRASFSLRQDIFREEPGGELLCTGEVRAAYLDSDTLKPARLPYHLFKEHSS